MRYVVDLNATQKAAVSAMFGDGVFVAAAPGTVDPSAGGTTFPGYYAVGGVVYLLREPLNSKWAPSITQEVLAGNFTPAHYVGDVDTYKGPRLLDPSNAPDGVEARSPAGYPLQYGLEPDPAQMAAWQAGTRTEKPDTIIVPGMQPRVAWGGDTYANDQEVEDHIARISQQPTANTAGFSPAA